jgi:AraC-like DNA-binding protein
MLRPLLRTLSSKGVDVLAFLHRLGLPETAIQDEETVVPLSTLYEAFETAERLLGDPLLGAHIAANHERGSFGLLEYTFRTAPTLGEAFRRLNRYGALYSDLAQMTFEEGGDQAHFRHWVPGYSLGLGRHVNELVITLLVLQMLQLTGARIVPETIWFAHPAPPDVTPLTRVLGTAAIEFGTGSNGISLAKETLPTPLSDGDPVLLSILERVADDQLATIPPVSKFSLQVRKAVRERMTGVVPELSSIAAVFRMSERTFQRRLGGEGTNFNKLIDGVREEMAKLHVAARKLSLGEIAYLLGYTELSAFLRAFKRWTGVTPQRYRG